MAKRLRSDSSIEAFSLILADLLSFFICWGPGLLTWFIAILWLHFWWFDPFFWLKILVLPFLVIGIFLLSTFLIRISLPVLKPGVFSIKEKGARSWFFHFQLSNGIYVSGLRSLLFTNYLCRWLYFRAMGADIAWGVHMSVYIRLREYPLISIGKGSSLGANTHISCHTYVGDRVLIGPVYIGKRCFIGMNCVIGPKTSIGDDSWVGFSNLFLRIQIPNKSKIENFQYERGINTSLNETGDSAGGDEAGVMKPVL